MCLERRLNICTRLDLLKTRSQHSGKQPSDRPVCRQGCIWDESFPIGKRVPGTGSRTQLGSLSYEVEIEPYALISWNPNPPPPPPGQGGGECGGFLGDLKARFAIGGGGFLRICFTHSSRSGSEVGIGLVSSFLTVISSCGHWCRLLDFCSFVSTSGFEK